MVNFEFTLTTETTVPQYVQRRRILFLLKVMHPGYWSLNMQVQALLKRHHPHFYNFWWLVYKLQHRNCRWTNCALCSKQMQLREAPFNFCICSFGHCPNSHWTHPPALKRALWGTYFWAKSCKCPFVHGHFSRCHKPAWQGFRPPQTSNAQMNCYIFMLELPLVPNYFF